MREITMDVKIPSSDYADGEIILRFEPEGVAITDGIGQRASLTYAELDALYAEASRYRAAMEAANG